MTNEKRSHWGSRLTFILATSGSAIGLGNIWKFPYIAGVNGGGSFVLIYLACIALVGIPIFIAELYIGQQSQKDAIEAFEVLHKPKTWWRMPGWLGLVSAFLILSFYSVVGGWILDFELRSIMGEFAGAPEEQIKETLGNLFANPLRQIFFHILFMAISVAIVLKGLRDGLERWTNILMPALFVLLLALLAYSFTLDGFPQAISFLFSPDSSKLTAPGILEAVGHSFFTLSLGMGVILTYGSYLSKKENLVKVAFTIAFLDTAIALIAGIIIFSIVFTFGLEPGAGPGLIFSTLPTLFAKLPGGAIISILFFLLVTFAAITSAVSILEVVVAYLHDKHKICRKKATISTGAAIGLLGLLTVFSTNIMAEVKVFGLTFFDLFDKLTSSYFLPIGGLLISLFFGWILGPKAAEKVVGPNNKFLVYCLVWLTRIFAPVAVLLVIYNGVFGL